VYNRDSRYPPGSTIDKIMGDMSDERRYRNMLEAKKKQKKYGWKHGAVGRMESFFQL